jgi:hypothetical protein
MPNPDLYLSAFFVVGVLVVTAFAWQRFNEPSFPNRKALPRTLSPLRYLFLRSTYQKARLTYVGALLMLYVLLVAPGPKVASALGTIGIKDFPPEGWALVAALILTGVGLAPDSLKWLNTVEEQLRRWIHEWFLVPDGIERTVGVLEDAHYEPPPSQLNLFPNPRREKLREDLKLPPGTLRHRWARATILMTSLRHMGAGAAHPLKRAAFGPFEDDFEALLEKHHALKVEIESVRRDKSGYDEEKLTKSVDALLKLVYAYISWGVRHQADTERQVDQTLEELGFIVPQEHARHLFDIVFPAILLIALITTIFWGIVDVISWFMGKSDHVISESVVRALYPAIGASLMYGSAVVIALKRRSRQIGQRVWREHSPTCLIPIAIRAGLVTWAVTIGTTVFLESPEETWQWLGAAGHLVQSLFSSHAAGFATTGLGFLPIKITTALPWVVVGATASAILAGCISGDAGRIDKPHRLRDAIVLGIAVGLAAVTAQLIQGSLSDFVFHESDAPPFTIVPIVGLAGLACGVVIGFMVPQACRANIVTPPHADMARALRSLLRQAESALGTKAAAEDWVFMPNDDLGGITPAEAAQYKTQATGVGRLLENEASQRHEEVRREGLTPVVIEGGLADQPVSSRVLAP